MANTVGYNGGTGTSALAVMPDDITVGDFVWAWINSTSASVLLNNLAGWSLGASGVTAVDFSHWVVYKIWQSGDSAPTFGFNGSTTWTVDTRRVPGGYTFDKSTVTAPVNNVAVTNTITPNTGVNNAKIFFFASVDATGSTRTWTNSIGTEVLDRMDNALHRQVVEYDIVGAPAAASCTHTVTGSAQDQQGIAISLAPPPPGTNVKHKYKSGGVFTARPIKHKSGGVFTYRPIKSKTGGVFS